MNAGDSEGDSPLAHARILFAQPRRLFMRSGKGGYIVGYLIVDSSLKAKQPTISSQSSPKYLRQDSLK